MYPPEYPAKEKKYNIVLHVTFLNTKCDDYSNMIGKT